MAAVQPMLYAEAHRDTDKHKDVVTLHEMTLTGMARAARRAERAARQAAKPEDIWKKVSGMMQAFGGR